MPYELRGSPAAQRNARLAYLGRFKWPAILVVTSLAALQLYERYTLSKTGYYRPASSINLGWQSNKSAYYSLRKGSSINATQTQEDAASLLPGDEESTTWWGGDEDYNDAYDGFAPEPTAEIWDPFILNPRPLVEITAKACIWPPSVYDTCMPESSHREDAERGKWIRVEKDLNLRVGIYYLYLFYRRLPLYGDAPTIREFKLLTKSEEKTTQLSTADGWHKVTQNLRDGVWPTQEAIYLYYRTQDRKNHTTSSTKFSEDEINEIDVIWGSSGTLYGWDRMHRDFAEPKEKNDLKDQDEGAELMWRKGSPLAPQAQLPLSFTSDGSFKILQIADLHFSVGKGKCLDSNWPGCKDVQGSDNVTLDWLGEILDEEKPDLVILSGDQLNGQDTSYSSESVLLKVAHLFEKRTVPWAAVLGNHDSEKTTLTRYGQFVMMQALPYFVGEPGPIDVDGEGNYQITLYSADESRTPLFNLYFLDSHANAATLNPWSYEYDWIKESQIAWFKNVSSFTRAIERPFSPPVVANSTFGLSSDDSHQDGGGLQGRNFALAQKRRLAKQSKRAVASPMNLHSKSQRRAEVQTTLKKPNAIAVFHIPLPEVYDEAVDMDPKSKDPLAFGEQDDSRGAPKKNSGFFKDALLAQTELGHVDEVDKQAVNDDPDYAAAVLNALPEVKVVLNGHCHISDQCRRIKGIWNCFAGGSSYSGYARVGWDRRVRVLELSDYGETIKTYKILDTHTDTSGTSESSTAQSESNGSESTDTASPDQLLEAGGAAENDSGTGSDGLRRSAAHIDLLMRDKAYPASRAVTRGRRGAHVKVDELVLVGDGAPGYH